MPLRAGPVPPPADRPTALPLRHRNQRRPRRRRGELEATHAGLCLCCGHPIELHLRCGCRTGVAGAGELRQGPGQDLSRGRGEGHAVGRGRPGPAQSQRHVGEDSQPARSRLPEPQPGGRVPLCPDAGSALERAFWKIPCSGRTLRRCSAGTIPAATPPSPMPGCPTVWAMRR